jgi:hypothetical protein
MRRLLTRAAAASALALVVYTLPLVFPEPLFAHRIEEGSFLLYSRDPVSRALVTPRLRLAEARLERAEIHRRGESHRVFVTGSKMLYRLVNGPYTASMARNVELGNAIYLPNLDPSAAKVVHFDGRSAPLEEILAHEAIHTFVQQRLGLARAIRLPFWKKEGYAQYVALDFFPLASGVSALRSADEHPTLEGGSAVPRHYLEAAVVWAHRISVERESFDDVIEIEEPFPELLEEALRAATEPP